MNILKMEKFPYLLTILFALVGWGLTHTVDRLINSPIIEYRSRSEFVKNGKAIISYEIMNISRDRLFENVEFKLLRKGGCTGKFLYAKPRLFPPMDLPEEANCDDGCVRITVPELHPDWKFILTVELSEPFYPTLHFSSKKSGTDNKAIRLLRSSVETYLVKHELRIIAGLIVLWSSIIAIYLAVIGERNNSERDVKPNQAKTHKVEVKDV